MTNSIQQADQLGGKVVIGIGDLFMSPIHLFNYGIKALQNLPVEPEHFSNTTPELLEVAKKIITSFTQYHSRILKSTSTWSGEIRNTAENATKFVLSPISFCKIGKAIQTVIAEKTIGNIAQVLSFIAMQVFHILPYTIIAAFASGVIFLYYQAPVALITCFAGSLLLVQVYFIIRLVKEIEVTNKILETNLNSLQIFKSISNVGSGISTSCKKAIRWTASWIPISTN